MIISLFLWGGGLYGGKLLTYANNLDHNYEICECITNIYLEQWNYTVRPKLNFDNANFWFKKLK